MKRALVWGAAASLVVLAALLLGVDTSSWGTQCGAAGHVPPGSAVYGGWTAYRCKDRATAGTSWSRCLRSDEYADPRAMGCKDELLCCPAGSTR